MKKKLLSLAVITGVFISSCKKDNTNPEEIVNKPISEISAPASFTWSGSRDVSLSIGISDNSFGNAIHVVKVYTAEPSKGGELVSTGSATLIKPFNTKITLSSMINEVYIEKVAPNGTVVSQTLALSSDKVSASISATGLANVKYNGNAFGNSLSVLRPNITVPSEISPDCDAAYDIEITPAIVSQFGNDYKLLSGKVYVIKQNNINITFNQEPEAGTTLRICGSNVTVRSFKIKNGTSLIITSAANNVNLDNFSWDQNGSGTFKNFGETTVGNIDARGTFINQGTLKMGSSTFTLYSGSFVNSGPFTCNNFIANAPYSNSGTMTVAGFTANANATGKNTGTIKASSNFQNSATFSTTGTLTLSQEMQLQSGSDFSNTGTITVAMNTSIEGEFATSGNISFNGSQVDIKSSSLNFTNSGEITTANNTRMLITGRTFVNNGTVREAELHLNSGGKIINNCKWFITSTSFKNEINGPIENNSYFSVGKAININSGGKITLNNGALFVTKSIYDSFSEKITGTGTGTSVLKITEAIPNLGNHQGSAKFSGKLQVVYTSGTLPATMFEGAAVQKTSAETVYIPTGNCMEEGSGTEPVNTDPDGDNVHGDLDKFPNDDTRAYIFQSQNYTNGGYTLAFEDKWPLKGDYDLNDVVVNYKYEYILSAANKIVDIKATYVLVATGGDFQNGFGVEFPVAANKMTITSFNVTPAPQQPEVKLESGQDKAVLILFSDSRQQQLTWNTQNDVASSPTVKFEVMLHLTDGPLQSEFGTGPYNPFIWNNSQGFGRGYETHLYGKTPTNKVNTSLFGTGDDRTGSGKYYGTANNLPWGITLPVSSFKYPLETVPITEGYLKFANWAISGGTSSIDWYLNTETGYRDDSKLYNK